MSTVSNLVQRLREQKAAGEDRKGVRLTVALSARNHDLLARLALALDVPSGVLAARLLAAALDDAATAMPGFKVFDGELE